MKRRQHAKKARPKRPSKRAGKRQNPTHNTPTRRGRQPKANPVLDAARDYHRRGWCVIPVKARSKAPAIAGWPNARLTEGELGQHFAGPEGNIGVVLGEPSGGLVDVDLDCPEAEAIASLFLPETLSFGHGNRRASHRFYVATVGFPKPRKFTDPLGKCVVELRADKQQTVVPPSTHESGEPIEFYGGGTRPAEINGGLLREAVADLTLAVGVGRGWPAEGSRQECALALAGTLIRANWTPDRITRLFKAICLVARDSETEKRIKTILSTSGRADSGYPITGWSTLKTLVGEAVANWSSPLIGVSDSLLPCRNGEAQRASGLNPRRLSDFLAEDASTQQFVVAGLLPEGGLSILAAKPKVGKSTLVRSLALDLARGVSVFGRGVTPAHVVYVALEDHESSVRDHFRLMGAEDERITIVTKCNVAKAEENLLSLREIVMSTGAKFVIIDTLFRFIPFRDGNDYTETVNRLGPLLRTARDLNVHILACHHLRKGSGGDGDAVLGSSGLFATVDTLLTIENEGGKRVLRSQLRNGEELPPTYLTLDPDTHRVSSQDVLEAHNDDFRATLLSAIQAHPDSTEEELRGAIACDRTKLSKELRNMCSSGLLTRTCNGAKASKGNPYRYALIPSSPVDSSG